MFNIAIKKGVKILIYKQQSLKLREAEIGKEMVGYDKKEGIKN